MWLLGILAFVVGLAGEVPLKVTGIHVAAYPGRTVGLAPVGGMVVADIGIQV